MFKHLKKPETKKATAAITSDKQINCGHCDYARKASDANPDWQCPCCGSAYSKVNKKLEEKNLARQKLREKNRKFLNDKKNELDQVHVKGEMPHWMKAAMGGVLTVLQGVGTACTAANPLILALGAAIIFGSAAYGLYQLF